MALQNVWPVFEALTFPILVLISSPYYFMVIIGLMHSFAFFNAFFVVKWRVSAIFKAIYPIILHICFFIFMLSTDQKFLGNTSILYLSVLLVGAVHHFIESLLIFFLFLKRIINQYIVYNC